jgi:cytochrome c oxidase subunit 2
MGLEARRHLVIAGAIWAVASALGIAAVLAVGRILPVVASREAGIVDGAFVLLTAVSVPVLMLVVVGLVYSAIRFRARPGEDGEGDGPPIHGHRALEVGWLVVTLGLVGFLALYGSIGLIEIRGGERHDLRVEATALQWQWRFAYPDLGITSKELVVPVGERIQVTITSRDVVHSFSVPAFGVKMDAVPGRTTTVTVTPTEIGGYGVQCAELCGFGHTRMTADVAVVSAADFEAWVAQQRQAAQP